VYIDLSYLYTCLLLRTVFPSFLFLCWLVIDVVCSIFFSFGLSYTFKTKKCKPQTVFFLFISLLIFRFVHLFINVIVYCGRKKTSFSFENKTMCLYRLIISLDMSFFCWLIIDVVFLFSFF